MTILENGDNMNCKQCREFFVNALYDELSPEEKQHFTAHLQECSDCTAEYQKLSAALKLMDQREREQPQPEFWETFWDKLAGRIEKEGDAAAAPKKKPNIWELPNFFAPQWAYRLSAAAAILLIGIFIGKFLLNPTPQPPVPVAGSERQGIQQTALETRTQNYLDRSKVLLLGISNLDSQLIESNTVDFSRYQRISRGLVQEAGYLKTALHEEPRQRRLRKLVNDLEVILLQIANLEAENDISGIEMVQSGIDRQGIMLKINLEEIRRSDRKPAQTIKNGKSTI
jgi:hypothetical protein